MIVWFQKHGNRPISKDSVAKFYFIVPLQISYVNLKKEGNHVLLSAWPLVSHKEKREQ